MTTAATKPTRPAGASPSPGPATGAGQRDRRGVAGLAARASHQLGLVTRAQALEVHCSDRMLARLSRTGQIERVHRGVYRWTAVPRSAEQAALAACLAARGSMASGVTAMRLFGFEPGRYAGGSLGSHVISGTARHRPRSAGIIVHRGRTVGAAEQTTRHLVPVTSPVRTLIDTAAVAPPAILERFVGHLLATRAVTAPQLELLLADVSRRGGRRFPGVGRLRSCLERCNVRRVPDSAAEHRLLVLLRKQSLPEPVLQFAVFDGRHFLARVDAAYPQQRLAVEVDGFRWHSDPRTFRNDRRRANRLVEAGWIVLRTTVEELDEGAPDLLRQLRELLEGRAPADHRVDRSAPTPPAEPEPACFA